MVMTHQRHRWTEGQTDNVQSQDRALHYSASRGKNTTQQVFGKVILTIFYYINAPSFKKFMLLFLWINLRPWPSNVI